MARPIDIVRKVCPRAKASYLAAINSGDDLFKEAGIVTPLRLAHFLAQICHESGGLTIEWESGAYRAARIMEIFGVGHHSAAVTEEEAQKLAGDGPALFERVYGLGNPKKAAELGNIHPGDGWRYRGGGLLQTTGRGNYRRMGRKCGVDFENFPQLVLSAEHALKPALSEWTEGDLNHFADADDILPITRRINGGLNGLADRRAWLAKIEPLIDSVTLSPVPLPPRPSDLPAPKPKPTKKVAGTVAGTAGTAGAAASAGAPSWLIAAIVIVGIAVAAYIIIKHNRD